MFLVCFVFKQSLRAMVLLLHTVFECICLLTVTQSDGTTAALGTNTTGAFGPFGVRAGSADENYYVKLSVRVFDNYGSFCVYDITPGVQVTCVCIIIVITLVYTISSICTFNHVTSSVTLAQVHTVGQSAFPS